MIDVNPDLLAFLKEEETRSRNEDLLDRAEVALNSYNGELYGDEEDGRSKVVTRDVAEVVDHMGVSVLRVFVSGDKVVEYEPSSEEEEQFADDATERVNMDFQRSGYQMLADWLKEGNICVLGIVKSSVRMKKKRVEQMVPAMFLGEIDAVEAEDAGIDEATGLEMARVIVMEEDPEFVDELVPLEEYRISPDARYNYIPYEAHATLKTLSELVEMGFDRDDVESLTSYENNDSSLSQARDNGLDAYSAERRGALRKVMLFEEYCLFDANNDGIAEQLCIHRVGDNILRIEECDYTPFSRYCPFPMPGRIAGHSLAEKVTDIQRINTVLNRLALDGLYTNLAPGYLVHDQSVNENTYDDILTVRPNRVIRWTGNVAPQPENKNDVSAIAWQAMQQMTEQRERRTGITRVNQGLDTEALAKGTAAGMEIQDDAGQQMEEYVARNFGEAVASLMRIKLKLLSRYGKKIKMRVDGTFREVDPSQWPEEMNVITRVGLGSSRKKQRLQNRMTVLEIQKECMMAGLPIVGPSEIYKSIAGVIKDASLGSPADFVIDPDSDEFKANQAQKEPQPDPEQMKLQAEMQMQQAKLQGDQQMQAAKMQGEQQLSAMKLEALREEAAIKAELTRAQAQEAAQLARDKADFEAQLAQQKFAAEMAMEEQRMAFQAEQSRRDNDRRDFEADAKVSANRAGGDLDK